MASHAEHNTAQLTVFEPDARRFERAKHAFDDPEIELINTTEGLPAASYDVVMSAGALNRVAQTRQAMQEIAHALSPGGLLLAVAADRADALVSALKKNGTPAAAVIGKALPRSSYTVVLR